MKTITITIPACWFAQYGGQLYESEGRVQNLAGGATLVAELKHWSTVRENLIDAGFAPEFRIENNLDHHVHGETPEDEERVNDIIRETGESMAWKGHRESRIDAGLHREFYNFFGLALCLRHKGVWRPSTPGWPRKCGVRSCQSSAWDREPGPGDRGPKKKKPAE